MAGIKEFSSGAQTQVGGALSDGTTVLDLDQEIEFQAYSRVVLPYDKFVYWQPTGTLTVKGSIHWSQDVQQSVDETAGVAHITFTTREEIEIFSSAPINTIYIAEAESGLRFAFSAQQGFYTQAGLWHYSGKSIYPSFDSQILDRPGMIDPARAVVSNSLPLWIALSAYKPFYGFTPNVELFPSFLVDPNIAPPYGAVHIEGLEPLQTVPYIDSNSASYQLVCDRVRITLYGLQSDESIDFMNAVIQYSRDTENFGLMSMPAILDGKRAQPELQTIAMQKTLEMRVSYLQSRVNTVARQLITQAVPTILIQS